MQLPSVFLEEVKSRVDKERISRDDLEGAVQRTIGDASSGRADRTQVVILVVGLAVLGSVALAYSLGRRKGHLSSAVVEVRRL